jgi:hypothetical protein
MVIKIIHKNKILAIILRAKYKSKGIKFFTPNNFSQQLGYMHHPRGHTILPHTHNHMPREVNYTNEVLFVKSGEIRVDFYDDNQKYLFGWSMVFFLMLMIAFNFFIIFYVAGRFLVLLVFKYYNLIDSKLKSKNNFGNKNNIDDSIDK